MKKKQNDPSYIFETMPIKRAVLSQAWPAVLSQIIALIYNLADTYFVGKLNDPNQIAAIAVVYPSFLMLSALSGLFGIGGASLISRSLGSGDKTKAEKTSALCFWMTVLITLIFILFMLFFRHPVLTFCGAKAETINYALDYALWVIAAGGLPVVLNSMFSSLLRAGGYARAASIGLTLGGVLNILLDPIFCLPQWFNMGVRGAAIATAASNAAALVFFIIYILHIRNKSILSLNPKGITKNLWLIKDILAIGFPAALQTGLTVVSVAVLNAFVAPYGNNAIAALGIVKKIDFLPLYVSIGVAQSVLPLIGYNYAAKNYDRVKKATLIAGSLSCGFALICVIFFEAFAHNLIALFIKNPETISFGAAFLRRMCIAMPLMAIGYLMIIKFQAMGKAREAMAISILRKGVLDVPLLFLMTGLFALNGAMLVQPIVDTVALIAALALNRRISLKDAERS